MSAAVQKLGMDVWTHIEDGLNQRRLNAAWLGRKLGLSRQVISGWKTRGVPTARYEEIAALFGWSLDRLVTGEEPAMPPAPAADDIYSPMALDLARVLDEIPDIEQKQRSYALMLQIARMNGGPSPLVPSASVPDRPPPVPVAQPRPDHHYVK